MTACVCALSMALTGCQIGNKDIVVSGTLSSRQVFTLDKSACSVKEAKVYLANYQNIYGTAYTIDLWQHDFGDASLLDYVKDITLEELTRVYTMDLLAQAQEVTLSEDETAKVAEAAKEYYASLSEDETAYMDVAETDIAEYYTHYALAQKLYHSLTNGVNEEVSDDEARVMEIMQIYVTDEDRAREVEQKLAQGDDFASVANNYNELSAIQVTVSRDDLPDEVEEVAFQLDDNAVSGMIATGNGYYFIKCLNKYNEDESLISHTAEALKSNRDNMIDKSASLVDEVKALKKEIEELKKAEMSKGLGNLMDEAADINGIRLITKQFKDYNINDLRGLSDQIKADSKNAAMVFAAVTGGKVTFLVSLTDDLVEQGFHAGKMIKEIAADAGGGGGGKADIAQAGAKDPSKIAAAFDKARELLS